MNPLGTFEAFEAFGSFRLSAWSERGVIVADHLPLKVAAPKVNKKGFDLKAFLGVAIAAILPLGAAAQKTNFVVDYPSYIRADVDIQVGVNTQSSVLASLDQNTDFSENAGAAAPVDGLVISTSSATSVDVLDGLSQEAIAAVGPHGVARLRSFSQLEGGWDGGYGAALKETSLEAFDSFMRETEIYPSNASVFMTHEGHVVLNWLNPNGQVVELEFGEGSISFYDEASSTEKIFDLQHADKLLELLRLPKSNQTVVFSLAESTQLVPTF